MRILLLKVEIETQPAPLRPGSDRPKTRGNFCTPQEPIPQYTERTEAI